MSVLSKKLYAKSSTGHIHKYKIYSSKSDASSYSHFLCIKLSDGSTAYCPLKQGSLGAKGGLTCYINSVQYYADNDENPQTISVTSGSISIPYTVSVPNLRAYSPARTDKEWVPGYTEYVYHDAYTDSSGMYHPAWTEQIWHDGYWKDIYIAEVNDSGIATVQVASVSINWYDSSNNLVSTTFTTGESKNYSVTSKDYYGGAIPTFSFSYSTLAGAGTTINTSISGNLINGTNYENIGILKGTL